MVAESSKIVMKLTTEGRLRMLVQGKRQDKGIMPYPYDLSMMTIFLHGDLQTTQGLRWPPNVKCSYYLRMQHAIVAHVKLYCTNSHKRKVDLP